MNRGASGASPSARRISATTTVKLASETWVSGQIRTAIVCLSTTSGRCSSSSCSTSNALGDSATSRPPARSCWRPLSKVNGAKRTLIRGWLKFALSFEFDHDSGGAFHHICRVPAAKAAANLEQPLTPVPQPPDGDKIATEVEREMEQRLYRLRHAVLAPAEYHIYLHPDDFTHIKDVASLIELDVQLCLNAAVERMNGRSSLLNFVLPKRPPVEVPRGGWAIHIKPALNGDVGPGELAIHSRLSVPQTTRFGSGAGTVRITQTVVSGTERRTLERDEPHTAASSAPQARRSTATRSARLTYSDETGEHEFTIAKELIKIGR